jgi:hypothetical protein
VTTGEMPMDGELAEVLVRWAADGLEGVRLTDTAPVIDGAHVNLSSVYWALVKLGVEGLPDASAQLTPESPAVLQGFCQRWVREEAAHGR